MQKEDEKNMVATTTSAGVFIKPNVNVTGSVYNMAVSGSSAYNPIAGSNAQIAITGSFNGHPDGSFTFSSASFQQIHDNFYASNQVIPVNYEHVSSSNGARPAIGWVTGVYSKTEGDALYAWIDWIDESTVKQIEDGQYLFISPSINFNAVDEKTGKDIGAKLISVAVTNTPFLKGMEPLVLKEISGSAYLSQKDNNKMLDKNNQEVEMAYGMDVSGSMDMAISPEDHARAMLLVDVIQGSLISAIDAGLSVDSSTFTFELKDDGSVSVMGVDASGAELTHDVSVDELMLLLED